jgi:hypothetical protein
VVVVESFVSCDVQCGYIEQISPDCAAAAAAGAVNALLAVPADSPATQSQHAALQAYAAMFQQSKQAAVGKISKALAREADAEAAIEHLLLLSAANSCEWRSLSSASLRKQLVAAAADSAHAPAKAWDKASFAHKLSCCSPWSDMIITCMKTIVKADAAIAKLTADRASTSAIGNIKLSLCTRAAAAAAGLSVQASTLFSKKPCSFSRHVMLSDDSEAIMQEQWEVLKKAVEQPDSVLLFHLRNHYALIAGHRTLLLPCGQVLQQILCSRKGQRPKHWIDFRCSWMEGDVPRWSVRDTLLKWVGYKIIMMKRARAGFVDKDATSISAIAGVFSTWRARHGSRAEYSPTPNKNTAFVY